MTDGQCTIHDYTALYELDLTLRPDKPGISYIRTNNLISRLYPSFISPSPSPSDLRSPHIMMGEPSSNGVKDDTSPRSTGGISPSSGPAGRQRTSKACENCRVRRVKCTGDIPCKACLDGAIADTCYVRVKARPKRSAQFSRSRVR